MDPWQTGATRGDRDGGSGAVAVAVKIEKDIKALGKVGRERPFYWEDREGSVSREFLKI